MASFKPSKIVIIGGTGTIGTYITASILRAKPAFPSVSLLTSANTASTKSELLEKWKAQGLSVVVADISKEADVSAAFADADTVISCVGRGALQLQLDLLRLAEESGSVKWFFPSEYGTDVEHNDKSPNEKPHQVKLKVRKYVREEIKRVKVTYVVTGPYFDMWVDTMPGIEQTGGFVNAKKEAYLIEGSAKIGFCTMWDVGKGVVAALTHPEESFNKALKVQSFVVSPDEVLAEYEKQSGAKWAVTRLSLDDLRALETKLWEEGNPRATGATLRRIWAEGGTLYAKNDNELIGLKPEDMESLAVGVKSALAGGYRTEKF
ncbi:hypothetical protein B0H11DRAFT_1913918 [Mycena galericulata]|nr:hypothetical protein B0H11DRAFT_1913918 [Mycena galericulata]